MTVFALLASGPAWSLVIDMLMGLVVLASGFLAWSLRPGRMAGLWITLAGVLWFLSLVYPPTILWHRAAFIAAILTFPGDTRGPTRWSIALALAIASVVPPPVSGDLTTLLLAVLLCAVAWSAGAGAPRGGSGPRAALPAATAFSAALATGPTARLMGWDVPASVVAACYAVLAATAALWLCLASVRDGARSALSRLVIDVGREARSTSVRVGRLVGDPSLTFGMWLSDAAAFVDPEGRTVAADQPGRRVSPIMDADGSTVAILVHDPAVVIDPRLTGALASIARLSASAARARARTRRRVGDLEASRRRLVSSTDAERRRVAAELDATVGTALGRARARLAEASAVAPQASEPPVRDAIDELDATSEELFDLARGTLPRALVVGGLTGGIAAAAARSPVSVQFHEAPTGLPPEVESAAYFVCLEGMGNAVKHASASHIVVAVVREGGDLVVTVSDDGVGRTRVPVGASAPTSGEKNLRDRVEALGGSLELGPGPRAGTVLRAVIPITGATAGPSSRA